MSTLKLAIQHIPLETKPEGLDAGDNYLVVKVGAYFFSYAGKGDSIMFHMFSPSKNTIADFDEAVDSLIEYLFEKYKWCKMLIVTIARSSLVKLAKKHGFEPFLIAEAGTALLRKRENG